MCVNLPSSATARKENQQKTREELACWIRTQRSPATFRPGSQSCLLLNLARRLAPQPVGRPSLSVKPQLKSSPSREFSYKHGIISEVPSRCGPRFVRVPDPSGSLVQAAE